MLFGRHRRRLTRRLEREWGRTPKDRLLDGVGEADAFEELDGDATGDDRLEPQSWHDLGMESLIGQLDRTRTGLGRQLLYRHLRAGIRWSDAPILQATARRCSEEPGFHVEVGVPLEGAGRELGPGLWILTRPGVIRAPIWYWIFPILALLMVGSLAAFPFEPRALLLALPLAAVNMTMISFTARRMGPAVAPIRQIGPLLRTADALARLDDGSLPGAPGIRADLARLGRLQAVATLVSRDPLRSGELAAGLWGYLNLMLLLDPNALLVSARELRRHAPRLEAIATWVGQVDLGRAVASLREEPGPWSIPDPEGDPIRGRGVWHPLITDPVGNDVDLVPGRGIVVTGANMAGKSTYLRAVAIANHLARTLGTCPAESWSGGTRRVRSLMSRTDDLEGGRSYYQVEVDTVIGFIREARDCGPTLYLLDEPLRGTNTIERIAAGEAVLRALLEGEDGEPSPHSVMVATHDDDLRALLAPLYEPRHFRETVTADRLLFDYRCRPGPATTRTAIALLERSGAPANVIASARARFEELSETTEGARRPPA